MSHFNFNRKLISVLVLSALSQITYAAETVDLGTVGSSGSQTNQQDSIVNEAPTQTSLQATEPQSIITQKYIQDNTPAGGNYTDIIAISPSVVEMAPNGPGLMESGSGGGTPTIRGFQDGQYNVTFDGIPWGDSNDFTHHSTVYFMSQDIGSIVVDRGPGDASTIGNATYGGTIAISSVMPTTKNQDDIYGTWGSWNTRLIGADHNSGMTNDTNVYASLKSLNSDGFLTNSGQSRNNAFLKFEKFITNNTVMTAVAMYNHNIQHVPNGSTPQQQAQYGYNFGLVNNSQSEANSGWNYDDLSTDFEYLGLKSTLGKWSFDEKLYTYAYFHNGYYGANPGSVTLADTIADGGTSNNVNNVPGTQMHNNYRSVGNLFRGNYLLGRDKVEFGVWLDRQKVDRMEQQVDWSLGGAPNNIISTTNPATLGSIDRQMLSDLNTVQGYAQYVWQPINKLTITPGFKYDSFTRTMDAAVNQKSLLPYSGSETWDKVLKSINARYAFNDHFSGYAQYSEGFLAPNMNVFYKTNVDLSSVNPTTTKNYQIGTNWKDSKMTFGVDYYRIDANNVASQTACPAGYTNCFSLTPTVQYSGVELEGTYALLKDLMAYGNFSKNNYYDPNFSSDGPLSNAPNETAALGLIRQDSNLYTSIVAKYIGPFFSNGVNFGGYTIANFNANYKFEQKYKIGLGVYNLFNKTGNLTSMFSNAAGSPLFYVIPERSYQVSFSAPF